MLQKEFLEFYSSIKISGETEALIEKREILDSDIKEKFPDKCALENVEIKRSDIEIFDQGSYCYNTTIKDPDGSVDRDVAVVFPIDVHEHENPIPFKKHIRDVLLIKNRRIPVIKEPCITVSYKENGEEKLHIDFPLYGKFGEAYYLARGREFSTEPYWEEADPKGLNKHIKNYTVGNSQLRRIISYMKKWKLEKYGNSQSDNAIPASIGLTLWACWFYSDNYIDNDLEAFYDVMKKSLNSFDLEYDWDGSLKNAKANCKLPTLPYSDVFTKINASNDYSIRFYNRLKNAVNTLNNAINSEEHEAGKHLQKVLGDSFPVPEKQSKSLSSHIRSEHNYG